MNAPVSSSPSLRSLETHLVGRIEDVRSHEKKVFTTVISPAPDPYSHPVVTRVRSNRRMGQRGEDVDAICRIVGFRKKPFRVVDKVTGEVENVVPVEMFLELVE